MANSLKQIREQKGLSLKDVASLIGCTKQGYWNYEKGLRKVPLEIALKLSKVYEISVEDIFFYDTSNHNVNNAS